MPFATGHRICVGNNHALLNAGLMLATVCQTVTVQSEPGHRVGFEPKLTLRPRGGMPMRVAHRSRPGPGTSNSPDAAAAPRATSAHGTAPDQFSVGYRKTVDALQAEGVTLLTMTLPEPPALRHLAEETRVRFSFGLRAYNALLRAVADEVGAQLLDAACAPAVRGPGFWTADGLHPSPQGHALIAAAAGDLLLR
jgi:GDSL-like Lipase/Acylhydrolase family